MSPDQPIADARTPPRDGTPPGSHRADSEGTSSSPAPTATGPGGSGPRGSADDRGGAATLADPLREALRLVALADEAKLSARLMGGLAFHARCPDWTARVERDGRDIDLASRSKDRRALTALLVAQGYTADRQYNALYGHKQLYFYDEARGRPLDVIIDRLEMCHRFEFAARLAVNAPTLPLAELLLSKLQIAKINRKDVLDFLALLADYPLGTGDDATINVARIVALTSADWGWWRTVTGNLDHARALFDHELRPDELDFGRPHRHAIPEQLAALRSAVDAAPKSTRWKIRAQIGERVQWYDEPEEVGHGR